MMHLTGRGETLFQRIFLIADDDYYTLGDKATFGDKQKNVAMRQNHSAGDATDTQL